MLSDVVDIVEYKRKIDSMTIPISNIVNHLTIEKGVSWKLARFDLVDKQLSGNKAFKLLPYLLLAEKNKLKQLVSFGGVHSNHLHALAFAGRRFGFRVTVFVKGYCHQPESLTLQDIKKLGAEVFFLDRSDYARRNELDFVAGIQQRFPDALIIPEGGAGELGEIGAQYMLEMLRRDSAVLPDVITIASGTGTTARGFLQCRPLLSKPKLLVFAALKNASELTVSLDNSLCCSSGSEWQVTDSFCCGGFAKMNDELAEFMCRFYEEQKIKLDSVYTAKMCYGVMSLLGNNFFKPKTSILSIHTGGVQGVRGMSPNYQASKLAFGEYYV